MGVSRYLSPLPAGTRSIMPASVLTTSSGAALVISSDRRPQYAPSLYAMVSLEDWARLMSCWTSLGDPVVDSQTFMSERPWCCSRFMAVLLASRSLSVGFWVWLGVVAGLEGRIVSEMVGILGHAIVGNSYMARARACDHEVTCD